MFANKISARKCKKGFTLIELLVVIAIISILAAILFPVFARARENARRASCMSNLKQIGIGVMMYTQDFDEKLPNAVACGSQMLETGVLTNQGVSTSCASVGYLHLWWHMIYPYVRSTQVFICPSSGTTWTGNYFPTSPKGSYASYGYNQNIYNLSLSAIPQVAITPFILDTTYYLANAYSTCTTASALSSTEICSSFTSGHNADPPNPIHLDTFNMLFVDGHVKTQRISDWVTANAKPTVAPYTDPIWQKWDPKEQS